MFQYELLSSQGKRVFMSGNEFKVKELERLFDENKITLEEYLDARAKIESSQPQHGEIEPPSVKSQDLNPRSESSKAFEPKRPVRSYRKIALGAVLTAILVIGGFSLWSFLNPVRQEALAIESHSMRIIKGALLFNLKNTGTTDIRISEVKMNGYPAQTGSGWPEGWNGTTFLQPQQTGSLYIYIACYFYVVNASMPHLSSQPTASELDQFYSWLESYNSTFTIVTDTQHYYDVKVPEFPVFLLLAWMGSLTFTYMKTEDLNVLSLTWDSNGAIDYADLFVKNTGTESLTMVEVRVNGATASNVVYTPSATLNPGDSTTIRVNQIFASGVNYEFVIITAKGSQYTFLATAP